MTNAEITVIVTEMKMRQAEVDAKLERLDAKLDRILELDAKLGRLVELVEASETRTLEATAYALHGEIAQGIARARDQVRDMLRDATRDAAADLERQLKAIVPAAPLQPPTPTYAQPAPAPVPAPINQLSGVLYQAVPVQTQAPVFGGAQPTQHAVPTLGPNGLIVPEGPQQRIMYTPEGPRHQ